jgi:hypothetical protein
VTNKVVALHSAKSPSIESEQSVLGGVLLEKGRSVEAWMKIAQTLGRDDFLDSRHQLIFAAMRELVTRNIPVDIVTLGDALEEAGVIDQVGGWAYLAVLERDTPSSANIASYAIIVKRKSLERQRDAAISNGEHDQAALLTAAINTLQAAQSGRSRFVDVASLCEHPPAVNWIVGNYLAADSLALIFGDPGCGKSFVAIDLACHVATGRTWRGNRVKEGLVLYIAGEGRNGLSKRFRAWFERYDEPPGISKSQRRLSS